MPLRNASTPNPIFHNEDCCTVPDQCQDVKFPVSAPQVSKLAMGDSQPLELDCRPRFQQHLDPLVVVSFRARLGLRVRIDPLAIRGKDVAKCHPPFAEPAAGLRALTPGFLKIAKAQLGGAENIRLSATSGKAGGLR
jgi:hypothetical protein